jgi:NADPH:quinone reductase-like Zn-dependent oxidoreductase
VLRVEERPDPPVGAGDVRIPVRAAGINFADTLGERRNVGKVVLFS